MKRTKKKVNSVLANAAAARVAALYGFRSPRDCSIEELAMAMSILVVEAPLDLSLIHISEPTRQAESRMPSSA